MLPLKRKPSKVKNHHGLTESQEGFARIIADNPDKSLVDCYLLAYPNFNGTHKTACEVASRTYNLKHVKKRVEMIRDALVGTCPLTMGEGLAILAEIARDKQYNADTRIRAIDRVRDIARWDGETANDPEQIRITIVTETRERPAPDAVVIDVNPEP